ncbi:MAG: ABC transporter substrate-binding protein [Paracoccaceae bacterium]
MKMLKTTALTGALIALAGPVLADAHGGCMVEAGSIRVLGNDFGPINAVVDAAETCAGDGVEFVRNLTTEHRDIQVAALTADPAQYTSAIVANSSLVPLLNEGLVRPLDDLIAEHAPDLPDGQKIVVDGKTMAIAFMANAQHLYARTDVLEEAGISEVPTTYEGVLEAAEAIRAAGIMENPVILNTMTGWNLGEEFVNMYLGHGGEFFEPGTANVAINNETGIATLEMLASLVEYSSPDFLTFDSNATGAEWEAGNAALGQLWGSRAAQILDDEGSTEEITGNTVLAAAPTVAGGDRPASTLWWDGFTIAANISDEDAAATFKALMHGIGDENIEANNDLTVWLSPAYEPTENAIGVAATASAGAAPYPMLPYMGFLHTALGNELTQFLQGEESAEQALMDVEAAYTAAAREQGFVD